MLQSGHFLSFLVKRPDCPRSLLVSRARSSIQKRHCPEPCTHHQSRSSLQHLFLPHTASLDFHILLVALKKKERCLKHPQLPSGLLRTSHNLAQFCQRRRKCGGLSAGWIPREDHRISVRHVFWASQKAISISGLLWTKQKEKQSIKF